VARLSRALAELRAADDARRSRDKPTGALLGLSAYLVGFAALRTAANAYVYYASLRRIMTLEDAYGSAELSIVAACVPLAAGLLLSRGRADSKRRLALLPVPMQTRIALAALGPVSAALPIIALASLLPAIAALPIAAFSLSDYITAALWYPIVLAAVSLGLRSLLGAAGSLLVPGRKKRGGHARSVALAAVLASLAAANPRPTITDGRGALTLFGSTTIPALSAGRVSIPLERPALSLALVACCIAFAAAAALAEDAAGRGGSGRAGFLYLSKARRERPGLVSSLVAAVDAERRLAPDAAAALALAAISLAQGADPAIPLAATAIAVVARSGAAAAFLATDGPATRRLALVPARPGAIDRAYLGAAVAISLAIASPLIAAGVALALRAR